MKVLAMVLVARSAAWAPVVGRAAKGGLGRPLCGTSRLSASAAVEAPASSSSSSSEASEADAGAAPKRRERVLSGVQPTGALHLGNYLGAIRQWVANQDTYENYFFVVDMHAITAPHDPKRLEQDTLASAALYLAAGIDPAKSKIFVQSHVSAHAELCWLLNCMTPMNWLERMIQYKEKAVKQGENVGVGLFDYPVLMAADILLYQATQIPVGEDQRQHLELTRDIARRFNDMYCKKKSMPAKGKRVFVEPQALIMKEGARIMSLTDGTSKMSKSAENDASRINLTDPPEVIAAKIKKCKTDNLVGIEWDNPERAECTNLLNIYQAVQPDRSRESILAEVGDMNWGAFKPVLADAVVAHLAPVQRKYADIMADPTYLRSVLRDGADAADEIASETLARAKVAIGMTSRTS